RNGGHLAPTGCFGFATCTSKHGVEAAHQAVDLERYSLSKVLDFLETNNLKKEVDWANGGRVQIFKNREEAEEVRVELEAATEAGRKEVEGLVWLDERQVEKLGASKEVIHSALCLPDGNNLFPRKLVSHLFDFILFLTSSLPFLHFSLYTHTPCTSISSPSSSGIYTCSTPRGSIRAPTIVHATNAYISHLLPHLASNHPHSVVPTRGQCITVPPPIPTKAIWTCALSAEEGFEYFFQRPFAPTSSAPTA
ncbi:hypothetical protein BT69DRAFT_1324082, partial [Atractiella rhizophila]